MKYVISVAFMLCIGVTTVFAQENTPYGDKLREMFSVSGASANYDVVVDQMLTMFKNSYGNQAGGIEDTVWDELAVEFRESSIDDLVDKLVPVYEKHLTIEDLDAIIAFYKTPAGKKFADKTPLITQESMLVGQEWGMQIGQRFSKRMQEKGY